MQHFQVQYEDYRVFLKKIHGPIETTPYFLPLFFAIKNIGGI